MKEKDIERHIERMIINGLIKEAEQDDADFMAAMKRMSHEDFLALISGWRPEKKPVKVIDKMRYEETVASQCSSEAPASTRCYRKASASVTEPRRQTQSKSVWKKIMPWAAASAAAAAVLLIVLVPAFDRMDSRVCESALIACNAFMPPAKGGEDLATKSKDEIRHMLPELEETYQKYYTIAPEETTWTLVEAYLRLGDKKKAAAMLQTLADRYGDTEEGDFCRSLIATLE